MGYSFRLLYFYNFAIRRPLTQDMRDFFSSQIIAILAAILFPVFAQAREKAKQTSCLSNCKQMGLAVMMYAQDYDETYPLLQTELLSTPFIYNGYTHQDAVVYGHRALPQERADI
jgi:hypothetical protein